MENHVTIARSPVSLHICSNDVHHKMDESSAKVHVGCRAVLQGPIRTNRQPQLQDNPPTASGGIKTRIPSTRLFQRNERYHDTESFFSIS
ncbi:unnamed protein product [Protopolystoma xenopodis]|uniref:Uncharacterized protein n=1 Tax=Protopolystoma xenopodis TaxID=117903 RepID=A0A3S5B1Q2_9PLAT|nr:unnamed protein product [Protopolystoma xenopodis]